MIKLIKHRWIPTSKGGCSCQEQPRYHVVYNPICLADKMLNFYMTHNYYVKCLASGKPGSCLEEWSQYPWDLGKGATPWRQEGHGGGRWRTQIPSEDSNLRPCFRWTDSGHVGKLPPVARQNSQEQVIKLHSWPPNGFLRVWVFSFHHKCVFSQPSASDLSWPLTASVWSNTVG